MKPLLTSDLNRRDGRERAVAWALTITQNTSLAPTSHEQQLLEKFVLGEMSLDEVISSLENDAE